MKKNKDIFLLEQDNVLDRTICDNIIDRFNQDTRSVPGSINLNEVNVNVKQSLDLHISNLKDWKDIDTILYNTFSKFIANYMKELSTVNSKLVPFFTNHVFDTGYQIQKTKIGEFFTWHDDNNIAGTYSSNQDARILTYIIYLNDVDEGGETEFINGIKVKPTAGKGLIFPPHWTYLHRGVAPVSNDKYICTGWLCCKVRP